MRNEKEISWSKVWVWITGALTTVVMMHEQLTSMGITIPTEILPYFNFAATASAVITALRIRNTIKQTPESTQSEATPATEGK